MQDNRRPGKRNVGRNRRKWLRIRKKKGVRDINIAIQKGRKGE
jgi:hypothetical protein